MLMLVLRLLRAVGVIGMIAVRRQRRHDGRPQRLLGDGIVKGEQRRLLTVHREFVIVDVSPRLRRFGADATDDGENCNGNRSGAHVQPEENRTAAQFVDNCAGALEPSRPRAAGKFR